MSMIRRIAPLFLGHPGRASSQIPVYRTPRAGFRRRLPVEEGVLLPAGFRHEA